MDCTINCSFIIFNLLYLTGRPKRLFVFVNPFGGSKSASKIYLDSVKPLLEDADIQFTLQGSALEPSHGFIIS